MTGVLKNSLEKLNIFYDENSIEKIKLYIDRILFFNKKFNLVSSNYSNFENILNSHVIDSMEGLPVINEFNPSKVLDVGSGAGFPGLVLSIFDSHRNYFLLERGIKRATFLNIIKTELDLENVKILNNEIETEGSKYEFITFRAFRDLGEYAEILKSRLENNGVIMAYKGKLININREIDEIKKLFSKIEIRPFKLVKDKNRNFLLLVK